MGGTNQSTCPPVPATIRSKSSKSSKPSSLASNPIRSHENSQRGEVHFHDDAIGLKCAIDSPSFFSRYHDWRSSMDCDLTLLGHDGASGQSSVKFIPYVDDKGDMQISMSVQKPSVGQTILDLDTLASYP